MIYFTFFLHANLWNLVYIFTLMYLNSRCQIFLGNAWLIFRFQTIYNGVERTHVLTHVVPNILKSFPVTELNPFLSLNERKLNIKLLSHSSHISNALYSHVASSYHIGQQGLEDQILGSMASPALYELASLKFISIPHLHPLLHIMIQLHSSAFPKIFRDISCLGAFPMTPPLPQLLCLPIHVSEPTCFLDSAQEALPLWSFPPLPRTDWPIPLLNWIKLLCKSLRLM